MTLVAETTLEGVVVVTAVLIGFLIVVAIGGFIIHLFR